MGLAGSFSCAASDWKAGPSKVPPQGGDDPDLRPGSKTAAGPFSRLRIPYTIRSSQKNEPSDKLSSLEQPTSERGALR